MDAEFWHQRWENNQIGFHGDAPNPLLIRHIDSLSLAPEDRLFLPLCGKTLDIAWLLSRGIRVVGIELSRIAVNQLFNELNISPNITDIGEMKHYSTNNLDIYSGDFFALSTNILGSVDAIYDRAALVALPENMRSRYTTQLTEITDGAPQLLITFEYNQQLTEGPPFSVSKDEVNMHYIDRYQITLADSVTVPGGLRGIVPAIENVWLLSRK